MLSFFDGRGDEKLVFKRGQIVIRLKIEKRKSKLMYICGELIELIHRWNYCCCNL
jgi:hypothetical protein